MTDHESSREQKMTATGAFCVMAGLILSGIALLAFIVGLL